MCTESGVKFCQKIIYRYISAADVRNMNSTILSKVLSQLMRLTFQEPKSTARTSSALNPRSRGHRTRSSYCLKIRKTSVKFRRLRRGIRYYPLPLKKPQISCRSAVNKNSVVVGDGTLQTVQKQNKVPVVYVKDVLTTQGRTSKSDFMKYFGLQVKNGLSSPKPLTNISNLGFIKFSQAVNVPVSSDMGIIMAAKENQILTEAFKLRKIDRCEWYVNKPHIAKEETYDYPVTYVDKNAKKSLPNQNGKSATLNIQKMLHLKKFCRPVSVNIIRLDLLKMQKKLARNAKRRKSYIKTKLKKQSENLKVIIKFSEKRRVDELLSKKDFI